MNNNQIDKTSYYRLPCGKYLENFIATAGLSFALGSALKYYWRAGRKSGESKEKDMMKCDHYCKFLADNVGCTHSYWRQKIEDLADEAYKSFK